MIIKKPKNEIPPVIFTETNNDVSNMEMSLDDEDDYSYENEIGMENNQENESDDKFTWFNIICFSLAGLPFQLMYTAISVFGNKFLLDVLKIESEYTSVVLFVSRAIDAITDPIYGYLINMTPITRFGKMKPWIVISVILCGISYLLLWFNPNFDPTSQQKSLVFWATLFFSLFFTFVTVISDYSHK
jgi:Na+/melibiose symporter-like transporter